MNTFTFVLIGLVSCSTIFGLRADLNNDGIVDIKDFSILASEWLQESEQSHYGKSALYDLIPIPKQLPVAVAGYTGTNPTTVLSLSESVVVYDDTSFYNTYGKSWKLSINGTGASDRHRVAFTFQTPQTLDGVLDMYLACSDWSKLSVFRVRLNSAEYNGHFRKSYNHINNSSYGRLLGWENYEFRPIQISPFSQNQPQGELYHDDLDWTADFLFSGIELEIGAIDGQINLWVDRIVKQDWKDRNGSKIRVAVIDLDGGYLGAREHFAKPLIARGKRGFYVSGRSLSGEGIYPDFTHMREYKSKKILVGPHMRTGSNQNWDDTRTLTDITDGLYSLIREFEDEGCYNPGLSSLIFLQNASHNGFVKYNNPAENAYHDDNVAEGRLLYEAGILCTRGTITDPYFRTDFTGNSGAGSYTSGPIDSRNWIPPFGRYNYATHSMSIYSNFGDDLLPVLQRFMDFGSPFFGYIHDVTLNKTPFNITEDLCNELVNFIIANDILLLTRLDLYYLTYGRYGEWHVDPTNNKWVSRFDPDKRLIEEQFPLQE